MAAEPLVIGLSSWIIQDGNYGDFERGNSAFALEFYSPMTFTDVIQDRGSLTPSLHQLESHRYKALGRIVFIGKSWWVIDCGVLIYSEYTNLLPEGARIDSWVSGEIGIGIDPFAYFERLAKEPGAPALIYEWDIRKIEIQTAPFVEVTPRLQERDQSLLGWKEIERTNAWEDDAGHADYLIHCIRLDRAAKRELLRA